MTIIIIIVIAIIFGFGIKFINDANARRDAAEKAAKERAEKRIAKEKMRNNKILQMAVDCIVEQLQKNIKNAKNVALDYKTEDIYVAKICRDGTFCYEGLIKKCSHNWEYCDAIWFARNLNCVFNTCYYDEGYSDLSFHELDIFHEVLLEELKRHSCPTCTVFKNRDTDYDHYTTDYRYYLIWDLTPYHPQKEFKSFL